MIALLAIAPDGSSYSQYLETSNIHEARVEQRRLERLHYSHFQLVTMPIQNLRKSKKRVIASKTILANGQDGDDAIAPNGGIASSTLGDRIPQ